MKNLILLSLFTLYSSFITAQDTLEWYALDRYFPANIHLTVDVKVDNFDDIYSFQYGVKHDTSVLHLDSVTFYNVLPGYNLSGFGFDWVPPYLIIPGNMTTLWTDAFGYSLPKGTQVYNMHFTTKQSGQLINHLWPSTEELVFEAITNGSQEIPTTFKVLQEISSTVTPIVNSLKVYPNPTSDYVSLNEGGLLKIFDSTGTLLINTPYTKDNKLELNLFPGLYWLSINNKASKLIINE